MIKDQSRGSGARFNNLNGLVAPDGLNVLVSKCLIIVSRCSTISRLQPVSLELKSSSPNGLADPLGVEI